MISGKTIKNLGLIIGLSIIIVGKYSKNTNKYLLIKYEDLINKPDKTFLTILEFI